ncbi:uncharacterized protein LOC132312767 isoform X1 [Cornus florida]|uniref:uncharacterized protein LOC132312767 isoform X1 n=1 Tax=Cornus florida TaxID=4283 RepID=UPI00289B7562|nr:uncharacterized protein LOC132312767 isoform X1 [Cornus florida]
MPPNNTSVTEENQDGIMENLAFGKMILMPLCCILILLTDFVGERLADKQRIVTLLKRREGYFGSIETSVVKGMLRLLPRLKAHTSATLAPVVCSGLLLGSKGPLAPWAFDNTDRNRTGHNEMNTAIF